MEKLWSGSGDERSEQMVCGSGRGGDGGIVLSVRSAIQAVVG